MTALSIFSKICQNAFYLADIFQLRKDHLFVFINVRHMCEMQRSGGKFRLHKHLLCDKRPIKMLLHHFRYFHCSNFKMTFDENFMKKAAIFNFFQISTMSQNFTLWQHLAVK